MLDGFGFELGENIAQELKSELLLQADEAYWNVDRTRCIDAIERLYKLCDAEHSFC